MAPYDIVGNIAILKTREEDKLSLKKKKEIASGILKTHKPVKTVVEKISNFSGRLRKIKVKHLLGDKNLEALYRENGCEFRLNVEKCYFSSKLSNDRLEIAKKVKKGEKILSMFSGVGVYGIVIAKNSKCDKVVCVELNKECNKYARENVKRNKLQGRVEIVQGDVRKKIGRGLEISQKFDRIIMTRPNLKDDFLDVPFSVCKKGTMIHYHGFYAESELSGLKKLIKEKAQVARKKISPIRVRKAGEIGIKKYRYRVDIKVLN